MRALYFTDNKGFNFKRVNKATARRAYINGLTVVFCPVNLRPFGAWSPETYHNKKSREAFTLDAAGVRNDFNNLVNSFEFYNCPNSETGKYTAFYIPVETVDRFTGEPSTGADAIEQYNYKFMEV